MLQAKPLLEAVTVVVAGELDQCTAPQIRRQLDEIVNDQGVIHLVLDLENLTFMDSSGIGVLLGRLRALQARGGTLTVKNMQPPIEKLFRHRAETFRPRLGTESAGLCGPVRAGGGDSFRASIARLAAEKSRSRGGPANRPTADRQPAVC